MKCVLKDNQLQLITQSLVVYCDHANSQCGSAGELFDPLCQCD